MDDRDSGARAPSARRLRAHGALSRSRRAHADGPARPRKCARARRQCTEPPAARRPRGPRAACGRPCCRWPPASCCWRAWACSRRAARRTPWTRCGPRAETSALFLVTRPTRGGRAPCPSRAPSPSRTSPLPSRAAAEPTTTADSDARYPFVRLSSGELIRIALGEDGPLVADPALLGNELETARAFSGAEAQTAPCSVFATTDESHPFAVRFDDGQAFLADPVDEG